MADAIHPIGGIGAGNQTMPAHHALLEVRMSGLHPAVHHRHDDSLSTPRAKGRIVETESLQLAATSSAAGPACAIRPASSMMTRSARRASAGRWGIRIVVRPRINAS